jgi:uncharacterized protein
MLPLIEEHQEQLVALCEEFGIERLELFGSATSEEFDPDRSDLDFLVTYPDGYVMRSWLERHFALKVRLMELFGRRVDLIEAGARRNPFVIESIEQTRRLLYAA